MSNKLYNVAIYTRSEILQLRNVSCDDNGFAWFFKNKTTKEIWIVQKCEILMLHFVEIDSEEEAK